MLLARCGWYALLAGLFSGSLLPWPNWYPLYKICFVCVCSCKTSPEQNMAGMLLQWPGQYAFNKTSLICSWQDLVGLLLPRSYYLFFSRSGWFDIANIWFVCPWQSLVCMFLASSKWYACDNSCLAQLVGLWQVFLGLYALGMSCLASSWQDQVGVFLARSDC